MARGWRASYTSSPCRRTAIGRSTIRFREEFQKNMKFVRKALLAACTLLVSGAVVAQEFPEDKPISIVVGFVAGGAVDSATRLIANKLAENLGLSIAVLNKAGAGGNIAHQYVSTQPADGTTLLLGSVGPLTIAPHLTKVAYDPFVDLAPVSGGVHFPNVLVVHPGVGVKTFKEFMQLAKDHPERA